jgi:transposase
VTISGSNVHDSKMLEETVDAIPSLRLPRRQRGRPRKRPTKLHADKGYDYPRCRRALRSRGIIPRIARRGIESSERLGRYRWVVERTLSWLNRFRRLKVRYERRADIHQAFLALGCALICWRELMAGEHSAQGDRGIGALSAPWSMVTGRLVTGRWSAGVRRWRD